MVLIEHWHCSYSERGGEDTSVIELDKILKHFAVVNTQIRETKMIQNSPKEKFLAALVFFFGQRRDRRAVAGSKADIIIFHNRIPYFGFRLVKQALKEKKVIRVWHNFRNSCVAATHFRAGQNCIKCLGASASRFHGIYNKCYRKSFVGSLLVTIDELQIRKLRNDRNFHQVAVSQHMKEKIIALGYPDSNVHYIPNSVDEIIVRSLETEPKTIRKDFLFVGRLVPEKGIEFLLECWSKLNTNIKTSHSLHVVGDGPLRNELKEKFGRETGVIFHGTKSRAQISRISQLCIAGIALPIWSEPFGKTLIEYQRLGLRQIVTKNGAIPEMMMKYPYSSVVETAEPESLIKALIDFSYIGNDETSTRKYIVNWARNKYTPKSVSESWEKLLRNLLS